MARAATVPRPESDRQYTSITGMSQADLDSIRNEERLHELMTDPAGGARLGNLLSSNVKKAISDQYEYFCGSQVSLYINQILIDECVFIAYNLSAEKIPIYSYSGRKYATTAEGPILVRGRFGINFKESGYLFLIMAYIQEKYRQGNRGTPSEQARNIEDLIDGTRQGDPFREIGLSDLSRSRPGLARQLAQLGESEFKRLATDFEQLIWGKGNLGEIESRFAGISNKERADEFPAFDIYLTFGNIDDPQAHTTVRKLSDVELVGSTMQVNIDGEGIVEVYDFLARSLT